MKKIFMVLLLVFSVLSLSYAGAFVSYQHSWFYPDDDNLRKHHTWLQAIETGYSFNDYFEAGIEGSHTKYQSFLFRSTFRNYSLFGTLKLKYPLTKRFTVYGVAGIGNNWFLDKHLEHGETLFAKSSLGWKYGLGIQYALTKKINIFIEESERYGDTGNGSSLDSWGRGVGMGVKYYF